MGNVRKKIENYEGRIGGSFRVEYFNGYDLISLIQNTPNFTFWTMPKQMNLG